MGKKKKKKKRWYGKTKQKLGAVVEFHLVYFLIFYYLFSSLIKNLCKESKSLNAILSDTFLKR